MNMFSTKDEVDHHVKKLLSAPHSQHNNDQLNQMIATYYFSVKEYKIAKNYLDKLTNFKENKKVLRLKGKIYENLNEFEMAAKCYEKLSDLYSEECDLSKACECLLKCESINENKVKKWINILEKNFPSNENYMKLKSILSPNIRFNYTIEEINELKIQIKTNANDDHKIRFLRILENQNGVIDSLSECSSLINNYSILDNIEAMKICLSIFKKHFQPENDKYKPFFTLILTALLHNNRKICEYDRTVFIEDLMNLLKDEKVDSTYCEMFRHCIYHLTTLAHLHSIKTGKTTQSIFHGYALARSIDTLDNRKFSDYISTWLRSQAFVIRSITTHIISQSDCKPVDTHAFITEFSGLVLKSTNNSSIIDRFAEKLNSIRMLANKESTTPRETIAIDVSSVSCVPQDHLKLITWQMMCFNDQSILASQITILSDSVFQFLFELIGNLFPRVPLSEPATKRTPESICKIDILIFLIGAFLTTKKACRTELSGMIERDAGSIKTTVPYEMWVDVRIPEVVDKWWRAACDFTLQNKRNTSIGFLKDLLKRGLDSLQLIDNEMSESLKLHLGRLLLDSSVVMGTEGSAVRARAIEFLKSGLKTEKSTLPFKELSITPYCRQQQQPYPSSNIFGLKQECERLSMTTGVAPTVKRLPSYSGLTNSFGTMKTRELFDTEHIPDDMLDNWRLDACLTVVEATLALSGRADFDYLDRLIDQAEKFDPMSPRMHLLKSRVLLERAHSMHDQKNGGRGSPGEISRLVKAAQQSASDGIDVLYRLDEQARLEMHSSLQEQLNEVARVHSHDYSLFEFSTVYGETSNSNKAAQNQSSISNGFFNHSTVSNDHSNAVDCYRIDQLQSDIAVLGSSQDKIGSDVDQCVDRVNGLSKTVNTEMGLMRVDMDSERQLQKELYAVVANTLATLTQKTDRLEFQAHLDREDQQRMQQNIDQLQQSVINLTIENRVMLHRLEQQKCISRIVETSLVPGVDRVRQSLDKNMRQLVTNISRHSAQLDSLATIRPKLEKSVAPNTEIQSINIVANEPSKLVMEQVPCKTESIIRETVPQKIESNQMQSSNENRGPQIKAPLPVFDLSQFSRNKWQCDACMCMNDDKLDRCPACTTPKPGSKPAPRPAPSSGLIDLSQLARNKWNCPTCLCQNDDKLDSCPACLTKNPNYQIVVTRAYVSEESAVRAPTWSHTKAAEIYAPKPLQLPFAVNKSSSIVFGTVPNSSNLPAAPGTTQPKFVFGAPKPAQAEFSSGFQFGTGNIPPSTVLFGVGKTIEAADQPDQAHSAGWVCECTTENRSEYEHCIACSKPRSEEGSDKYLSDSGSDYEDEDDDEEIDEDDDEEEIDNEEDEDKSRDSDVIITGEPYVTEEQVIRARALMLPDHFYYFENLPGDDQTDNSDDDDDGYHNHHNDAAIATTMTNGITTNATVAPFIFGPTLSAPGQSGDSTQIGFESLRSDTTRGAPSSWSQSDSLFSTISASDQLSAVSSSNNPPVAHSNLSDSAVQSDFKSADEESVFRDRCRLYRMTEGQWTLCGTGDMTVLRSAACCRLVMRRDSVHTVCCNQLITKTCPIFTPMLGNNLSVCWVVNGSSSGEEPVMESFSLKFKSEEKLNEFCDRVSELQTAM